MSIVEFNYIADEIYKVIDKDDVQSWNNDLRPLGKNNIFFIYINKKGKIISIDKKDDGNNTKIRTVSVATGKSFPAFNMSIKLNDVKNAIIQQDISEIKKIKECLNISEYIYKKVIRYKKIIKYKKIAHINKKFNLIQKKPHMSFIELMRRVKFININNFINDINKLLFDYMSEHNLLSEKKFLNKTFTFVLELSECNRSIKLDKAISNKNMNWLNSLLFKNVLEGDSESLDIFGNNARGNNKKYPEINIGGLGPTPLYSTNEEADNLRRWGNPLESIVNVGEISRQKIKDMLEYITSEENRGKTWRPIKINGKSATMIVLPNILNNKIDVQTVTGPNEDIGEDTDGLRGKYENNAKRLIDGINECHKDKIVDDLRIIIILKTDKKNAKIILNKSYSLENIKNYIDFLENGVKNIPKISFDTIIKKNRINLETSEHLFPSSIVKEINTKWYISSNEIKKRIENNTNIYKMIDMFLNNNWSNHGKLLKKIINNSETLLLRFGESIHKNIPIKNELFSCRNIPSIIGLFLLSLKEEKGIYMEDSYFMLGKYFSLIDYLHCEWRHSYGNKRLPRKLWGNNYVEKAFRNSPLKSFNECSKQIFCAISWAKKNIAGQKIVKSIDEIVEKINPEKLEKKLNEVQKAQLILGYLTNYNGDTNG